MRTLLLASLALASTAARPAAACGFEPQAFLIDHSFVLLGEPVPAGNLPWRQLAPRTYDSTATAPAPSLARPRTFTLLGERGTQVVSTAKRVWFQPMVHFDHPTAALAVRGDGFRVALAGSFKDAKWIPLAPSDALTPERTAFAQQLGVHPGWISMSTLGEDLTILAGRGRDAPVSEVRVLSRDGYPRTATGSVIGAIEVHGMRFLLLDNAGTVTTMRI